MVQNRIEVLRRHIDVLVFLDVGMQPSTVTWAMARLAPIQVRPRYLDSFLFCCPSFLFSLSPPLSSPLHHTHTHTHIHSYTYSLIPLHLLFQVCLWGHPVTTGIHPHMDYFISSDAYHIDHDGSAHNRAQSNSQSNQIDRGDSNGEVTDRLRTKGTTEGVGPNDVDVMEGFKDGYAQGWFTESLVRMQSLGFSFDRASSLRVIHEALIASEPGLATESSSAKGQGPGTDAKGQGLVTAAKGQGLDQQQTLALERLLVDRPDKYYLALTTHLTRVQTAQSKSQSNQSPRQERDTGRSWSLSELLQRKQESHGSVRLIVCPQHLPKVTAG